MSFYDKLQLDPFVLKRMIHQSDSPTQRRHLFLVMFLRSVLLVSFAVAFISVINFIFGAENSYLAVVLFCMLLSLRFVHFGYKLSQSILGLGVVLLILGAMPLIQLVQPIFLRLLLNFFGLGTIFMVTSNQPKFGNPGLYAFSYVFLTGTNVILKPSQLIHRFELVGLFWILFSLLIIFKHYSKQLQQNFHEVILKDGLLSKKNLWLGYYALGISLILQLGYLIDLKRFMWVGIAFSSLISIYELTDIKQRFYDRIIGVVIGTGLFFLLAQVIPATVLSILGGICLGLCTNYRFKNIFNCFGALALAATLFGTGQASVLRISNNLLGLCLGMFYLVIGQLIYRKYLVKVTLPQK